MLSELHFIRPHYFLWLIPCLIVWFLLRRRINQQRQAPAYIEAKFYQYLKVDLKQNNLLSWLLYGVFALWILMIIGLSGPTWQKQTVPVYQPHVARVIILDVSSESLVQDLKPNRLTRAKYKIRDLFKLTQGNPTALLAYSNHAYSVSPLSTDYKTVNQLLDALDPSIMPADGHRLDTAIAEAQQLLAQSKQARAEIIVFTNNADAQAIRAADQLPRQYALKVIGLGTSNGGPIPAKSGFKQDQAGNILFSKLAADSLQALASAGHGRYHTLSADNRDLESLLDSSALSAQEATKTEQQQFVWADSGYWFAILALPIVLLSFRRGLLFILPLFMLPIDNNYAFTLKDLYQSKDQQAYQQFQSGEHAKAANTFENDQWKAASYYKSGDYEKALAALGNANDVESLYNKGNIYSQLGQYPEALAAYDAALKQQAEHADAKYNRDIIEQLLKQQQQQQQSSQDNSGEQSKDSSANQDQRADGNDAQSDGGQQEQAGNNQQDGQSGQNDSENQKAQNAEEQSGEGEQSKQYAEAEQDQQDGHQNADNSQKEQSDDNTQAEQADAKDGQAADDAANSQENASTDTQYQNPELEPWLARIKNDTGELLRRKFLLEQMKKENGG